LLSGSVSHGVDLAGGTGLQTGLSTNFSRCFAVPNPVKITSIASLVSSISSFGEIQENVVAVFAGHTTFISLVLGCVSVGQVNLIVIFFRNEIACPLASPKTKAKSRAVVSSF